MTKTFNNWDALKKAMQDEMRKAMIEAETKSYLDALHNASDYYSEGNPKVYVRTGQYGNSPRTTDVQGSGDNLNYEIYLDQEFDYYESYVENNGHHWTTPKIFDAIENGYGGTLGNHGRWKQTEMDIEKNIKDSFGKHFD